MKMGEPKGIIRRFQLLKPVKIRFLLLKLGDCVLWKIDFWINSDLFFIFQINFLRTNIPISITFQLLYVKRLHTWSQFHQGHLKVSPWSVLQKLDLRTFFFEKKHLLPGKPNMSPENQWLEDVFPLEIVPFLGDMFVFGGVPILKIRDFKEPGPQREESPRESCSKGVTSSSSPWRGQRINHQWNGQTPTLQWLFLGNHKRW